MQRIAPLEPPYPPTIQAAFDKVMPPGMAPLTLFRTMARNPRVFQRMFAGALLDPGSISLRQRELVILRTCHLTGCDYEWEVHAALFSRRAGLNEDELARLRTPAADGWSAAESALLAACDALHASARLSDTAWQALSAHFSAEQVLEILALAGYYRTISYFANVCILTSRETVL